MFKLRELRLIFFDPIGTVNHVGNVFFGYLAYYLFKDTKFLSNFGINRKKEKEEYKNLDITDADYEDIEKENES